MAGPPTFGNPFGYYTPAPLGDAGRVVYRGADQHVHELFLTPSQNGFWQHADLTVLTEGSGLTSMFSGRGRIVADIPILGPLDVGVPVTMELAFSPERTSYVVVSMDRADIDLGINVVTVRLRSGGGTFTSPDMAMSIVLNIRNSNPLVCAIEGFEGELSSGAPGGSPVSVGGSVTLVGAGKAVPLGVPASLTLSGQLRPRP